MVPDNENILGCKLGMSKTEWLLTMVQGFHGIQKVTYIYQVKILDVMYSGYSHLFRISRFSQFRNIPEYSGPEYLPNLKYIIFFIYYDHTKFKKTNTNKIICTILKFRGRNHALEVQWD